jgi:hypothetical protein
LLAHLFFGVGATYLVVQSLQGKRKQTFAAIPPGANAPLRALEHQVRMEKKQKTMSAPAALKRITTTSEQRVALPALPAMPHLDAQVLPLTMAGMGGTGVGLTGGGGGGGGSGNGGGLNLFGLRDSRGSSLRGTFFDLKQTPERQPTPMTVKEYKDAVAHYMQGGMNDTSMSLHYFKGPTPLFATQIFIPRMNASEGPKAFGLAALVQPKLWIAHYKGSVIAPDSGTYHFVGVCDDVLIVRFNGRNVLDCGSLFPTGHEPERYYAFDGLKAMTKGWFKGCGEGDAVTVEAGQAYPIDILIGEWPGGEFKAYLLMRKEGADYKRDSKGNPILPLFRTASAEISVPPDTAPVYEKNGPIWKTTGASDLLMDR